ncbi:exonuclease [Stenotrophomonas virus Jojan60]|nr:exonuclease [Stenotrophomonas virus Jojan60]
MTSPALTGTTEFDARAVALDLLRLETERDKQRLVGASNLSNPCTRCLAEDMYLMIDPSHSVAPRGKYYLGAVVGTAIHGLLEERALCTPGLVPETRVTIGEIPGYGVLKSTSDLYVDSHAAVVDWKTTTKEKLKSLRLVPRLPASELDTDPVVKARYKFKQYFTQLNLYGKGVEDSGLPVQTVSVVFIARDASTEADVWAHTQPYQREVAEHALDRATRIWQAMEQGRKPESFKSHDECYTCSVRRTEVDL